jgi:hypothetical protein
VQEPFGLAAVEVFDGVVQESFGVVAVFSGQGIVEPFGPFQLLGGDQNQFLIEGGLAEAFEDVFAPGEKALLAIVAGRQQAHDQFLPGVFERAFELGQQSIGEEGVREDGPFVIEREAALIG